MRKKNKFLNKNSTPFLLLAIIHILAFMILSKRRKQPYTWTLFLSNIGWAYLFEYLTLNLFRAYRYKPSLMKKRSFDTILGAILSQGVYVPTTATLLTLFKKNWKWKISLSFLYFCIERLFLRLKIYKVYWWKPIYTLVLLNLYFYISDGFYKALTMGKKWGFMIAHYLSINVILINSLYIFANNRKIRFGRGHFHSWSEHFLIVPLYSMMLALTATVTSTKPGIFYRWLMFLIHILIDTILTRLGILKMNFKSLLTTLPRYTIIILISRFFYKLIYEKGA